MRVTHPAVGALTRAANQLHGPERGLHPVGVVAPSVEGTVTQPLIYRRRAPLVEAHQLTPANAYALQELLGGRLTWTREPDEQPLLRLPKSTHAARAGDYLVHEITRDQPWYPYQQQLFEDAYEPAACPHCGR